MQTRLRLVQHEFYKVSSIFIQINQSDCNFRICMPQFDSQCFTVFVEQLVRNTTKLRFSTKASTRKVKHSYTTIEYKYGISSTRTSKPNPRILLCDRTDILHSNPDYFILIFHFAAKRRWQNDIPLLESCPNQYPKLSFIKLDFIYRAITPFSLYNFIIPSTFLQYSMYIALKFPRIYYIRQIITYKIGNGKKHHTDFRFHVFQPYTKLNM